MLKKKYQHFYILMFISMGSHANNHQILDLNISNHLNEDISFASFNSSSLFGQSNRNINLENFQIKNKILEGTYYVKLNINNKGITDTKVRFIKLENSEIGRASCRERV